MYRANKPLENISKLLKKKKVCADLVVPYPPGIPVLIPGQVVTEDIANFLLGLYHSSNGIEIHGLVQRGDEACLRLVKPG